jgi:hypothetical protein
MDSERRAPGLRGVAALAAQGADMDEAAHGGGYERVGR